MTEKVYIVQMRHPNGQQLHKKLFNITNHQENANQNHNEVRRHTSEMTFIKMTRVNKC